MANEVVVDALPYIDNEFEEPGMKEMVQAMIEEEKKRYRPTKNYLEYIPKLELHRFETEVMQKEFDRLSQRLPMETLSMKRYELPPPPTGKLTDLSAWAECVENSYAQLEHQNTRISNLELMQDYSCESWKSYLQVLSSMVTQAQKQLADIKRKIQEVNWQRKCGQTDAGEKLKRLEASWVGLVSKNYEIERACMEMDARIYEYQAALGARQPQQESQQNQETPAPTTAEIDEDEAEAVHERYAEPEPSEQVPSEEVTTDDIHNDTAQIIPEAMETDEKENDEEEEEEDEEEIGPQPL